MLYRINIYLIPAMIAFPTIPPELHKYVHVWRVLVCCALTFALALNPLLKFGSHFGVNSE
jgi:hypothetical protein